MIRRHNNTTKKLESINESNNYQLQPPNPNKRVIVNSLLSNLHKEGNRKNKDKTQSIKNTLNQYSIQEKDKMIKQLQEEIIYKKVKNDMIQEAFRKRQDSEGLKMEVNFTGYVQMLIHGCLQLANSHKVFKRAFFKSLMASVKLQKKSKVKSVKSVLIWIISWINHLFSFLSQNLIKK